jgi:hypothetical protein
MCGGTQQIVDHRRLRQRLLHVGRARRVSRSTCAGKTQHLDEIASVHNNFLVKVSKQCIFAGFEMTGRKTSSASLARE